MFYEIPTLKAVDADRTDIPASGLVDPVRVGTGTVHAAELKDGTGQASFCDCVHGVFKEFKAPTWIAAYFEAMAYAETVA